MKSLALRVIRRIFIEVVGDVGQRIQAREVRGAEDRGFGAPHIWPQNRVHLADGITLGQGIRDSCHKSIGTDADKGRISIGSMALGPGWGAVEAALASAPQPK